MYVNQKFNNNLKYIMLEIKLPREIMKSPLAMETALGFVLQGGGINTWFKKHILGALPVEFSLEIASLEGEIHFYIRTQARFRPLIESNLYAQYPGIEIFLSDDYTKLIRFNHLSKDVDLWGATYTLGATKWNPLDKQGKKLKKDGEDYGMPSDFFPIKTYVDYGLDKDPKEEFKVDPLTTLLEFMGGVGKGEYVWYQVLAQDEGAYNAKTSAQPGKKFLKTYLNEVTHDHWSLADMADIYKKQIRKFKEIKKGDLAYDREGNPIQKTVVGSDGKATNAPVTYGEDREVQLREADMTTEQKDEIEMINRKLSKPIVRAVVRLMYIARKEKYNGANVMHILSIMRPFAANGPGRNSFSPNVTDPYDYPWENFMNQRVPWRQEEEFEAFVEREGFNPHVVDTGKQDSMSLQGWEDKVFWTSTMRARKTFRLLYQAIFKPFYHPVADKVICLNLEELATLWHFPGDTANIPTLPRIDSTKGLPPVNLPQ
jgi:hypothetical protein